jgi:5-methylcytosine-specific restriction endonuclease McrA
MKSYTKIYLNHFGFGIEDFVPCEICGNRAVDIHHIIARSRDKSLINDITNLMALCREDHQKYGDKNQHIEYLKQIHNEYNKN